MFINVEKFMRKKIIIKYINTRTHIFGRALYLKISNLCIHPFVFNASSEMAQITWFWLRQMTKSKSYLYHSHFHVEIIYHIRTEKWHTAKPRTTKSKRGDNRLKIKNKIDHFEHEENSNALNSCEDVRDSVRLSRDFFTFHFIRSPIISWAAPTQSQSH